MWKVGGIKTSILFSCPYAEIGEKSDGGDGDDGDGKGDGGAQRRRRRMRRKRRRRRWRRCYHGGTNNNNVQGKIGLLSQWILEGRDEQYGTAHR